MHADEPGARSVPLSLQQRLHVRRAIAAQAAGRAVPAHVVAETYDVAGSFDVASFEDACRDVLRRHPGLTLRYSLAPDSLLVGSYRDPDEFRVERLRAAPKVNVHEVAFDGDDFRLHVTWIEASDSSERGELRVSADHLAVDGNSWATLIADLSTAYCARANGAAVAWRAPAPPAYAVFAERQRASTVEGELAARLEYWRGRFDPLAPFGQEVLEGSVYPRDDSRTLRQARYAIEVDARAMSETLDLTPFSLLTAVHASVRRARSGRELATTHVPADLRDEDLFDTVGWFSDRLILRHSVERDDDLGAVGRRIREQVFDALDHFVPVALLVEHFEADRPTSARWKPTCFVDVMDGRALNGLELAGCAVRSMPDKAPAPGLRDGVACWFTVWPERTDIMLQYPAEAWSDDAAATFIADLEHVLRWTEHHPRTRLVDIPDWPGRRAPSRPVRFS